MTPSPATPTTRERILAHLHENRVTTISGLSRAWGLTRADIRYHLNALVEEGLLEIAPRDDSRPAGRGRPVQHYRLTVHSRPDNLPALAGALLETLLASLPEIEQEALLRSLGGRLAGESAGDGPPEGTEPPLANVLQRFNQAVAYLNQHGYRARWEASANGPRILLRNCPYAAILGKHPHMCLIDRFLLERLVLLPLRQVERMNLVTDRPPACIFVAQG